MYSGSEISDTLLSLFDVLSILAASPLLPLPIVSRSSDELLPKKELSVEHERTGPGKIESEYILSQSYGIRKI